MTAAATEAPGRTTPPRLGRFVVVAAIVCALSASWGFARQIDVRGPLVEVHPVQTLMPLLLFALVAVLGRRHPERARWIIGLGAVVIVVLSAAVLPIVMNLAVDAGHPVGAWPFGWIVPVAVDVRPL